MRVKHNTLRDAIARCYLTPIELCRALVSCHNASSLGLPCHTCGPFSSLSIEHFKHCEPPSNITSSLTSILLVLLLAQIVNLQMMKEMQTYAFQKNSKIRKRRYWGHGWSSYRHCKGNRFRVLILQFSSFPILSLIAFNTNCCGTCRFERFCTQGSCAALSGEVNFFSFAFHYCSLFLRFVCNHGFDTYVKKHINNALNSNWTNEFNLSAITIDLAKVELSNIFIAIIFHFDTIELEDPFTQTNVTMNVEEEGGMKTFVIRSIAHHYTRRPVHDSIVWSTKIHQHCENNNSRMDRRDKFLLPVFLLSMNLLVNMV